MVGVSFPSYSAIRSHIDKLVLNDSAWSKVDCNFPKRVRRSVRRSGKSNSIVSDPSAEGSVRPCNLDRFAVSGGSKFIEGDCN